jgi:antibiotic biosynthesis monooxygenase (ABM) superfamily enzyme
MIIRIWYGYTKPENAIQYQELLKEEVFMGIVAKEVKGYRGIELIKRELEDEVEFITIMRFEELKDVKDFAGENYQEAYVPQKARLLLKRYDATAQHYEQQILINY